MKTIKIIHYPEGGSRTTEIFEAEKVKIVECYLNVDLPEQIRTFGSAMKQYPPDKYWVIILYLDDVMMLAGLNSKVYIMVDGKTVASYVSEIID